MHQLQLEAIVTKSKIFDTFLRIPDPGTLDHPTLDADWLMAHGISGGAQLVLSSLRDNVLPLVRRLQRSERLAWYMLLIHDYGSGVPTTSDDKSAYAHLRLVFKDRVRVPALPAGWQMTKSMKPAHDVDGPVPRLIGYQSECFLRIVESITTNEESSALKQMRQSLHYFANMAQMRVS